LEHKVVRQVLVRCYLPQVEQMPPQALVVLVVLAQVLQHCVETLLRLVGQEERPLLVAQAAAVEAHPMESAVQEGLAAAT
jgi:hypothetical protein